MIDFLSVSSKFEDLVTIVHDQFDYEVFLSSESIDSHFNSVLHLTSQIINESAARSAVTQELENMLRQTCESVDEEMEMESESTDDEDTADSAMFSKSDLMIQKQLFVATMLLLHAKLCLDAGQPASAVKYLGWCRIQCRKILRNLRSASCRSNSVSLDDIAIQVDNMLTMCYERLAVAFSLLGIRRKAEDHALMAVLKQKILNTDCQRLAQINIQDLIDLIERHDDAYIVPLDPIRSLMKVKALSTSDDRMVSQEILVEHDECAIDFGLDDRTTRINRILCKSKNALAYDDSFWRVPCFRAKHYLFINRVYRELNHCASQDTTNTMVPMAYLMRRAGVELKLRIYRDPGSGQFDTASSDKSTTAILKEIIDSRFGSGMCNAEAYYRLGLISLSKARENGELQILWNEHAIVAHKEFTGHADVGDCDSILFSTLEARTFFQRALTSAPPASFNLTKNILRCLALVTGPNEGQPEPGLITASLIHISVGGSARNIVQEALGEGEVKDSFQAFDDELLDHNSKVEAVGLLLKDSAALIPSNWNISTMAICPNGEVLITSLRVSVSSCGEKFAEISTACIFPALTTHNNDSQLGIHADVLSPLDKIIERSQKQLHGMTEDVQNEQYNEESSRRKWWKERYSIDEDLQSLLKYTEMTYFSNDPIRQKLIPGKLFTSERRNGSPSNDDSSECSDFGPGNLASKFEAAEREPSESTSNHQDFDKDGERSNLTKLTKSKLTSKLTSFGVTEKNVKKMRKAELIDLLLSEMENSFLSDILEEATLIAENHAHSTATKEAKLTQEYPCEVDEGTDEPCTILVLDEHLLRFPFESLDMLSNMTITRVPSLPFVLATLLETKSLHSVATPTVDPRKVKYLLDPESNLSETASILGPALQSIASKNGWEWEGVVGRMPSSEFMSQALLEENGLYLYCGHGGGEKAVSRSQVEELMTGRDDGIRRCRAPIILMGCSSGKLQSANMYYEPEGIALSYLYAGAPCVVGNLWDVTDRDIDRYCLTLMEDFLQSHQSDTLSPKSSLSLAKCVANARRACKLRFIVGSAPVCYGVPVVCSPSISIDS